MPIPLRVLVASTATVLAASALSPAPALSQSFTVTSDAGTRIVAEPVAEFDEPWAMTFLPDGRMLVTEKSGSLFLVTQDGEKTEVSGVPEVDYGGQGGLGDIVLHPDFAENGTVYLSYAEAGEGNTRGAAVARAALVREGGAPALEGLEVIWRQEPKVTGRGHYSHRLRFGPDGMLFVTSGDRQKQTPAQDMDTNLGKIVRLNPDGSVPDDNPFQDSGALARQFWTIGNRNMLGIEFDGEGRLWAHEMGPRGGDELNLIEPGNNYGWPVVSNGVNYSGADIPDHSTRPDDFARPEEWWTPVISPSGFVIYDGQMFSEWRGSGLMGGLSSRALIRVTFGEQADGTRAAEAERFDMGARVREVEQGPAGALWLLTDDGRMLTLTPEEAS